MGLIDRIFGLVFGGGANGRTMIERTAEVFMENTEKSAAREAAMRGDALTQYAAEFAVQNRGLFDRFMDALNRIPRPALALGTLGLFISALVDPIWFASRMQGIALVPEPLWWLLGAVVSFYFGARHQLKSHQFQSQISASMALAPKVMSNIRALDAMAASQKTQTAPMNAAQIAPAKRKSGAANFPNNAALQDWQDRKDGR